MTILSIQELCFAMSLLREPQFPLSVSYTFFKISLVVAEIGRNSHWFERGSSKSGPSVYLRAWEQAANSWGTVVACSLPEWQGPPFTLTPLWWVVSEPALPLSLLPLSRPFPSSVHERQTRGISKWSKGDFLLFPRTNPLNNTYRAAFHNSTILCLNSAWFV